MRLFEGTFKYFSGVAGITALIGSGTDTRLYELFLPQDPTYPAVECEITDEEQAHQFVNLPTIAWKRAVFTCYSRVNQTDSDAIAEAIYDALMGTAAAVAFTAAAGELTIKAVHFEGRSFGYEENLEDHTKIFWTEIEFLIHHDL